MSEDKPIIIQGYQDIPPMTVARGRMSVNDTGSWRNAEPLYIDHTSPCNFHCPAGNDVVKFLRLTAEGKYNQAWLTILKTSPLPGICGRVCPHPCETYCNRGQLGGRIRIHDIERFLADVNIDSKYSLPKIKYPQGKIAVIGAGPAGLSCAWQLNHYGYPVTVFEKHKLAGGILAVGIPRFRLPVEVRKREIGLISQCGTEIVTGVEIGKDITFAEIREKFAAVFIGVGYHHSYSLEIEGENHPDVVPGLSFLKKTALTKPFDLKRQVVVIGGGNTAVDTARTAFRLGAKVTVLYRRTRAEMPAIPDEIDELLEEGIAIEFLTNPVKIHSSQGEITHIECVRMKLGEPDASGRRKPIPIEGTNFKIETEQVFTAIGESADLAFLSDSIKTQRWGISTDEFGRTEVSGLFAGGDASTGEGTVTSAIGSGRKTAIAIKKFLEGEESEKEDLIPPALVNVNSHVVTLENLNLDYFTALKPIEIPCASPQERITSFEEIHRTIDEEQALYEAQRCLSCGSCPKCDNCYIFCPDAAIHRSLEPSKNYIIDIKHCKGCGICAAECPRFCIELRSLMQS